MSYSTFSISRASNLMDRPTTSHIPSMSTFSVDLPAQPVPSTATGTSRTPLFSGSNTPSSRQNLRGSFEHDFASGLYPLRWKNRSEYENWKLHEEEKATIEFSVKDKVKPPPDSVHLWSTKTVYICARGFTGGKDHYVKKTERNRNVPPKRVGCECRLTVKTYPYTDEILGLYKDKHTTHDIGKANTRFVRLHKDTRDEIERLLRLGVAPRKVLARIQGNIYTEENLANLKDEGARRSEFCTWADVRRIEKMIEQETVRLASQDGPSVLKWVENLRQQGHFVELKTSSEPSPAGSNLASNSFVLIIQTKYQKECWENMGREFAGLDATHNTTHYENMSLFTLLGRDRWGHGMPAAWMISSNGTEDTISFFLKSIRTRCPSVIPEYFMSDKDHAQMNAIKRHYPESAILLCWWHVLHAWQQHFPTSVHPELWDLLKKWIRIQTADEFWEYWEKIKSLAPPSVIEYLEKNWMGDTMRLWSNVYRCDRNIFQASNTNMLVEAWHHLLKGTFMQGKRNRRLDHLIHILIDEAMPHFIARHRNQKFGFHGADLETKERLRIEGRAKTIKKESVHLTDEKDVYLVESSSSESLRYRIDLDAYDCNCLSFPSICFCKHICAVQTYFPDSCPLVPTSELTITATDSIVPLQADLDHQDSDVEVSNDIAIPAAVSAAPLPSDIDISTIIRKLSDLALVLQQSPSLLAQSDKLLTSNFHNQLNVFTDHVKKRLPSSLCLPRTTTVAPNQHSWTETASVMGVTVKSKRKKHTDPYSGGERSGKKARTDALHANFSVMANSQSSTALVNPQQPSPTVPLVAPAPAAQNVEDFDPRRVDFTDVVFLKNLKRKELDVLCSHYHISKKGNKDIVISRLQKLTLPGTSS